MADTEGASSAHSALDLDPAAVALAEKIVDRGYPEDRRRELFFGAADGVFVQMASQTLADIEDEELRKVVAGKQVEMMAELKAMMERHIPTIMEALAYAYASEFSMDELAQLREFVDTPLGGSFFVRSSKLISNPYYAAALEPYFAELNGMSKDWQAEITGAIIQHMQQRESESGNGA